MNPLHTRFRPKMLCSRYSSPPNIQFLDYRAGQPGRAESAQPGREPHSQNFQPARLNEPGGAERAPQPNPQHPRTRGGPNFGKALSEQQRDSSK